MPRNKKITDKNPAVWAALRISIGFIFIWAFIDKLIGLGFATCRAKGSGAVELLCSKSWLEGGSPTEGFLKFGTQGPLAEFYQGLAGVTFVDWLFMIGLLLLGISLISGIALKLATFFGSLLLLMMWTAALLPENNPILDDHIIYIIVLYGVYLNRENARWSLRRWWLKQSLVKKYSILE